MAATYWYKQAATPLFPELMWSRPENRRTAGKLLIAGGNAHGFAAPAEAYAEASRAGIGTAKVLLPDAVKKLVGGILDNGEFAPSTPSGSFSQKAMAEFIDHSAWADAILLPGDLGRNSETAIVIEKFLQKSTSAVTFTKDAADYALGLPDLILNRPDTLLVITMSQLQKLGIEAKLQTPVTFGMDIIRLVDLLHLLTDQYPLTIIVKHLSHIVCAVDGKVSTTPLAEDVETWRIKTAAYVSVWWLQNNAKQFEALTTAIFESSGHSYEAPR